MTKEMWLEAISKVPSVVADMVAYATGKDRNSMISEVVTEYRRTAGGWEVWGRDSFLVGEWDVNSHVRQAEKLPNATIEVVDNSLVRITIEHELKKYVAEYKIA